MVKSAQAASDKHAKDIEILDLRGISDTADFFFICSAQSVRQGCAIAESIIERLNKPPVSLHHTEGYPESGWILLDFGEVIFHIFQDDTREHYDLEGLWSDAERVKLPGKSQTMRRKDSVLALSN